MQRIPKNKKKISKNLSCMFFFSCGRIGPNTVVSFVVFFFQYFTVVRRQGYIWRTAVSKNWNWRPRRFPETNKLGKITLSSFLFGINNNRLPLFKMGMISRIRVYVFFLKRILVYFWKLLLTFLGKFECYIKGVHSHFTAMDIAWMKLKKDLLHLFKAMCRSIPHGSDFAPKQQRWPMSIILSSVFFGFVYFLHGSDAMLQHGGQ